MKYNGCFRYFAVLSALQVHIEALQRKAPSTTLQSSLLLSPQWGTQDHLSSCQGLLLLGKTSGQTLQNSCGSEMNYLLPSKLGKCHVTHATTPITLEPNLSLLCANTIWCILDLTTHPPWCRWWCPCLAEALCTCAQSTTAPWRREAASSKE